MRERERAKNERKTNERTLLGELKERSKNEHFHTKNRINVEPARM